MLDALVQYAKDAEFSKMLPPTGFYDYSQPIRWVVQISEDGARLEESNLEGLRWARPYTGRTSSTEAHPLADEAAYALGVEQLDDKGGKAGKVKEEKHPKFLALLDKMLTVPEIGVDLRQAIQQVKTAIENKWVEADPRFSEVMAKDWVAFQLEYGSLAGKRLFQLPEAQAFWIAEAQERIAVRDSDQKVILGECAVCGENKPLISRIPVGVKLISKPGPLHSLNKSAFVSGRSGTDGHNNLCYRCADTASRSFNALAGDKNHRRIIVMDKSAGGKVQLDSLRNQVALYWVEKGKGFFPDAEFDVESALGDLMRPVPKEEEIENDGDAEEAAETKPKREKVSDGDKASPKSAARLSQLSRFLNVQWQATKHMTNLDERKFALAIFSPNVGRTALREWMYRDLSTVIPKVQVFLNAATINDAWGKPGEPQHINALMEALDSKNANLTRELIRTAYQGTLPPREMLALAVQRYRTLTVKGQQEKKLEEWQRQRRLHALAAILKLSLYYDAIKTEGGETFMTGLDKFANDPAYLCGRLLAVLEEAQQVYSYRQNKKRLKTTGVQRSFGAASASPAGIFPSLVKLATVAHLPKAGKGLNVEMETLVAQIVSQGGYPQTMSIDAQGKFGLGYWHQRGNIRASWSQEQKEADTRVEQDTEGDDA